MNWNREYPRPQLRRNSFYSLNGVWQLNGRDIKIPFPPESRLSDYSGEIGDELIYSRTFTLPEGFAGENMRVRLHFGAVDQISEVFVNDESVCVHEGGYLPFFADITDCLQNGENRLKLCAVDALNHDYPWGKQKKKRGGMWYTPVSGIWQSVWMEAVPENPIENIRLLPDLSGISITVETQAEWCEFICGELCVRIVPNEAVRIEIPDPKLWTLDEPYLYHFILRTENDCIESYFALRTIETDQNRILLNGKPLFINGVLDQGYFPDGIYLPETPAAYEQDILNMKKLGFNLMRKHCKVEPAAFYSACDRIGMLVMQDMVNSGGYNFILDTALPTVGFKRRPDRWFPMLDRRRKDFFTMHALETQDYLYNHPSLVAYTIFNEGWGQFEADFHYRLLKEADPSRIYDATSGWFKCKDSDVDSEHIYFRNKRLHPSARPMLLSECGGFARPIEGHMFNPKGRYGYGTTHSEDALTAKIERMWEKMVFPAVPEGLCGVIYTQVSDVEDEINGLYTYDREICKVNARRMCALAEKAREMMGND